MSGELPTVSVAIWTCDQERFIGEAIESALEQDYSRLEVVVADDHSRDSTPHIVADYAERYPDVVKPVLNTGSRSILTNVNRALAACNGELVAILDGDDSYLPGKIEAQVRAFVEHPGLALCHHPVELVDEAGTVLGIHDPLPHPVWTSARDLVARGKFVATASTMMRREAMPEGGVQPVAGHAPDWLLSIETARNGPILRLPQALARWRRHRGQITAPKRGSEIVYEDAIRILGYVRARYPELADACIGGRRAAARWEAFRRWPSGDLAWTAAGLRRALRYAPRDPTLWRYVLALGLRWLAERIAGTPAPLAAGGRPESFSGSLHHSP